MRPTFGGMYHRLESVVANTRPGPATCSVTLVAAVVSMFAIALADRATGGEFSLSVFYFVPVVAVTVVVSPAMGFGLAAASAVAWTLADASVVGTGGNASTQTWNGILRFTIMSFVVALLSALRHALCDAQDSERRTKDFLADAAHQLRTPVAAARTSAEALVLTDFRTRPEQLASNLIVETDRIARLVTSLLRLARLDQGDPPRLRPCDVEAVVRTGLDQVGVLAPNLELRLRVSPELPPSLLLDPVAVSEMVGNLLDNARRHAVNRIEVLLEASSTKLRITIVDDGPGLPEGDEERAFDRFVSLDDHGGSGLGLAIARSLAEAQGGALEYASRRFVVTLPAIAAGDAPYRHIEAS